MQVLEIAQMIEAIRGLDAMQIIKTKEAIKAYHGFRGFAQNTGTSGHRDN